ncbi:MAG: HD domain-containing phosphohydrolase [Planctomycetota bacterium]
MKQAREGMVLALPIQHPVRQGTVLLRQGATLEERSISRLREIHCPEVWIDYPPLEFIAQYINTKAMEAHRNVLRSMSESFTGITDSASAKLDYPRYRRAVTTLLGAIRDKPKAALFLNEMVSGHRPLARHAGNVCMLSLLTGLKLDFYLVRERPRLSPVLAQDVSTLGLAGMLHDVGMLRLEEPLLLAWEDGADEEDPRFAEHVRHGRRMLQGQVDPVSANAVLHHHQHFDGTGFPHEFERDGQPIGQRGRRIHIFARIITACDLFDRLSYPPSCRASPGPPRPQPAVRTFKQMLQAPYSDWVDPMVLRGLMAVVPPYAPGTIVELSDGTNAVVVEWDRGEPCRPTVTLLPELAEPGSGPGGFRRDDDQPAETIDLRRRPDLFIRRVGDELVENDNFYSDGAEQYDVLEAAKAMLNRAGKLEEAASVRRAG